MKVLCKSLIAPCLIAIALISGPLSQMLWLTEDASRTVSAITDNTPRYSLVFDGNLDALNHANIGQAQTTNPQSKSAVALPTTATKTHKVTYLLKPLTDHWDLAFQFHVQCVAAPQPICIGWDESSRTSTIQNREPYHFSHSPPIHGPRGPPVVS